MPSLNTFDPSKYDENLDQDRMYVITINVPGYYLNFLHKLLIARRYPSRSEVVRVAIREFIHKEVEMNRRIGNTDIEDLIEKINGTETAVCIPTGEHTVEMHKIVRRLEY